MDTLKNPNLETTHMLPSPSSSQDFKRTHLQHNHPRPVLKKTHEDDGFIIKNIHEESANAYEVIKKTTSSSCSSQDFKRAHHQHNHTRSVLQKTHEDEGFNIIKNKKESSNAYEMIKKTTSSQDFKIFHHLHNHTRPVLKKTHEDEGFNIIKNHKESANAYVEEIFKKNSSFCSSLVADGEDSTAPEESGRERLKRHRVEMTGRVWIPEIWGHEDLLKDWIDCTVFDSSLGNNRIMSARAALVQERRSTLRIENRC